MKILGINCSPRKGKTTFFALEQCLGAARKEQAGIKTEIMELGGMNIHGCCACGRCKETLKCSIDDDFAAIIPKLCDDEVKGIVIGTPVYFGTMASQCKAFLDRTVMFRRNGFLFRNKAGAALAVGGVRNGGQELTLQAVQAAMLCHDMIVVGDGMNTSHFGASLYSGCEGGIQKDEIGLATARNLGRRMAITINMLRN